MGGLGPSRSADRELDLIVVAEKKTYCGIFFFEQKRGNPTIQWMKWGLGTKHHTTTATRSKLKMNGRKSKKLQQAARTVCWASLPCIE